MSLASSLLVEQQGVSSLVLYRATLRFQVETSTVRLNPGLDKHSLVAAFNKLPSYTNGKWPATLSGDPTRDIQLLALYQMDAGFSAGTAFPTDSTANEIAHTLSARYPWAQPQRHAADLEQYAPLRIEASVASNGAHSWASTPADKRTKVSTLFPATTLADSRSPFDVFIQLSCRRDLRSQIERLLNG